MANKKTSMAVKRAREESMWGYLMVAPTIIGLLVLNLYPFLNTLVLSFSKTKPFGLYELRGIQNYVKMFQSPEFWRANWNTIYFCILTVPVGIFLSLTVAVMLNAKIKGRTGFRAIFFLPMVVAPAAVAMVWKWMFNTEYGIINTVLGHKINWVTDPNIIMRLMSSIKVYDLIYMMVEESNPALTSAQSLMYLFYRESFVTGNRGFGSAVVIWTVALIGLVTVIQFWGQKKWVNYEV